MKKLHLKSNMERQAGVTLLLAVLVLGAITTIVFGIAAVTVNEVRTSADVSKSAPSITGAEAIAEEYMFKGVRGLGALAGCDSPEERILTSNKVKVSSCASYYQDNPYSFTLNSNEQVDIYLINPADQSANPGYTDIAVFLDSFDGVAELYLCDLQVSNCAAGPYVASATLDSVSGFAWAYGSLEPDEKYQLVIINTGDAANFRVASSPNGVPSGFTTIENTGTNQGTTRKLRTVVPQ
jgi:hypothetical protein